MQVGSNEVFDELQDDVLQDEEEKLHVFEVVQKVMQHEKIVIVNETLALEKDLIIITQNYVKIIINDLQI